jgi:hypothetical protein
MFNAPRQQLILATALVVSLLAVAPDQAQAACKNSGPSINAHKYGSQVMGQSVTICSIAVKVTPARVAVVKQKPVLVAKPAPKPQVSASYKKLLKQLGFARVTKPKAKVFAKSVSNPKATVSKKVIRVAGSNSTNGAAANFTPAGASARVYPSNTIEVGTQANFVSTPVVHYRAGTLQLVPTEVRFTPIAVNWTFDDGQKASGTGVGRSFSDTGTHSVTVSVIYAVAYRVRGSAAWIQEPDQIEMTNQLQLDVIDAGEYFESAELAPEQSARVLLVGSTCLAKPAAFGC